VSALPADQQLLPRVLVPVSSIADVITIMQNIDSLLPNQDGLKWFNRLYLMVTQQVQNSPPFGGFKNPVWLTRLDVVFAGLYFAAIADFITGSSNLPSSWEALFEARFRPGIDRIQFALAGMNAHINHDLALALLQTDKELGLTPGLSSPEHDDFEQVNGLLEQVLEPSLKILATGTLGMLAQDTGKIGRFLAIWNVGAARDLAWDFADQLRKASNLGQTLDLIAQDRLTGVIGRSLLLPV
jgi:hypothetical protein